MPERPAEPRPAGLPAAAAGTPEALAQQVVSALSGQRADALRALAVDAGAAAEIESIVAAGCPGDARANTLPAGIRQVIGDSGYAAVFDSAHAACRQIAAFDDAVIIAVERGAVERECGLEIAEDVVVRVWTGSGTVSMKINDPIKGAERWRLWGGLSCDPIRN